MKMQLVGLSGVHSSQTFPLSGETTIGREAGNTIVCGGDSSVSRRHVRIVGSTIEDLGSSNGTFVNGVKIAGPTTLKSGDEIRAGNQSWRFEDLPAVGTIANAIPPMRPREVSRSEQAQANWTPGTERIYGGPRSDLSGCAVPSFTMPDLSGCLRALLLLLIAFVVIALIAGLLMFGFGAVASLFSGSHGSSGAPPSGTSGGSSGGSGGATGGEDEDSRTGIHIRSVRVASTWHRDLDRNAARILVTWDNLTDKPVHRIVATVTTTDANGNLLVRTDHVVIYDGQPVAAGGMHQDSETAGDGFDPPIGVEPAGAKIKVVDWE